MLMKRITYTQSWDRENRLLVVTNTTSVPNAVTRFVYDGDPLRCAPRAIAAIACCKFKSAARRW